MQINKSRLGGLRRIELYGNPGTPEGRIKGGKTTVNLFHSNPTFAKDCGFIIRKKIKYPERSIELAEFMGIMLGDGGFPGTHQFTISFNHVSDRQYAEYVCRVIRRLFLVNYHIHKRKGSNGADIVINSSNLTDFLIKQGLIKGNKVKNQVDVPRRIHNNKQYQVSCLRGLMDTDGGLYFHKYNVNGKVYTYLKLGFTNCSKPLLNFVFNTFKKLDYRVYLNGNNVSVCSMKGVKKYFAEVGSHNPKHLNKLKEYLAN